MKKILAIVVALAMVMALAIPAFAADEYTVALLYADADWYPNLMSNNDDPASETCPKITITGDGTYSIETEAAAGASGVMVLCIDIRDVLVDHPDVTATLDSIEVDGEPFEFDASKILYGNIETDNNHYRIEIYNEYGNTKSAAPFLPASLKVGTTFKVTFTVSGLGAAADEGTAGDGTAADNNTVDPEAPAEGTDPEPTEAAPTETTTPDTDVMNVSESSSADDPTDQGAGEDDPTESGPAEDEPSAPSTGLALAVVPAVVALAAAVVSKKH